MTKPIDTTEIRDNLHIYEPIVHGTLRALCDEIDRLRGVQAAPQWKTAEVRVAVAVNPDGTWSALGGSGWDGDEAMMEVDEEHGANRFWLTATLPVPEEMEAAARVGMEDDKKCPTCGQIGNPSCSTVGCPD